MASEDSDQLGSGLTAIHGLSDFSYLRQTLAGKVGVCLHHLKHPYKLLEVVPLRSAKRILAEEGNDCLYKIQSIRNHVLMHMLAMIIVSRVAVYVADLEELLEFFETTNATSSLRHDES